MNLSTAALLAFSIALLPACAATSGTPETAANEESVPTKMVVDDEVPNVSNCHTDSQICPLSEPLQPGLACFCAGADGQNEAGSAGD